MSRTGVQTLMDTKVRKKKAAEDAEEAARLREELEQFEDEFGESTSETLKPKAFIRMDIVNANKSVGDLKPSIYKPALPNPLAELSKKSSASSSLAKNTFEEAKRMAAHRARKMLEDAHKGKPGPAPIVVVPTTNPPINRPPKPGTSKAREIQKSKTSNLDDFKEELKRLQAERDTRKNVRDHLKNDLGVDQAHIDLMAPPIDNPYIGTGTSGDVDDTSATTNLYIGNLPLDVTMDDLLNTFGTFGPLASGKILFPRGDEERKREYLCGFIAYMSRKDFDRAFTQMPGAMIRGEVVKISYARQVIIPPVPFYIPSELEKLSFPDPPTGLPFNALPRSSHLRQYLTKWKTLPALGSAPTDNDEQLDDYKRMIKNATVRVVIPTDSSLLSLIHRTIEFIVREGPIFEMMLMARESNNPLFRFLFDNHHPAHVYYRWKLYSVLQGERPHHWRKERFRLFDEGSWWQPPIATNDLYREMPECLYHTAFSVAEQRAKMGLLSVDKDDRRSSNQKEGRRDRDRSIEREKRKSRKNYLSSKDRNRLEDMLRELIPEKESIGSAMVWCLDHATWSKEISECLYESLTIPETPLHKKIARLYLIADILANAAVRGVKDVFYFRQHLEVLFPKVFSALGSTLRHIDGRLKAEQFKQRVMNCFRAWEDVTLYPTDMLIYSQNIFLGLISIDEMDKKSIDGEDDDEDLDGAPINDDKKDEDDEDVDGIPLGSNHHEPSTTSNNWNCIQSDDDDMDGVPIEEAPIIKSEPTPTKTAPLFKPMQWSTIPDGPATKRSKWEENEEEEEKERQSLPSMDYIMKNKDEPIFDDDENSDEDNRMNESKISISSTTVMDDERRRLIREIEVKVMALQDELEQDGSGDVKKKVEKYRNDLMRKMEDKLGKDKKKEKKEKEKDKDKKDKKKDKERGRSRSRSRERRRSKSRERKRDRSRDREKERDKERDRDRERERDKDRRDRRDADRDRDSRRDRRSRSRDRRR